MFTLGSVFPTINSNYIWSSIAISIIVGNSLFWSSQIGPAGTLGLKRTRRWQVAQCLLVCFDRIVVPPGCAFTDHSNVLHPPSSKSSLSVYALSTLAVDIIDPTEIGYSGVSCRTLLHYIYSKSGNIAVPAIVVIIY